MRYFAAGEYGGKFGRPHYHVLVFGEDFLDGRQLLGQGPYYTSPLVDEVWGQGFVTLAPLEPGAAFYTAGYALKNSPESGAFYLASRRPYIGHGWLARYHDDIARTGHVVIDGKRLPIPRSYLLRPEYQLELELLKLSRREWVDSLTPEQVVRRRDVARSREANLLKQCMFKGSA